jgi:hypothetical protein
MSAKRDKFVTPTKQEPAQRKIIDLGLGPDSSQDHSFALRAHCGRDARGPSRSLDAVCDPVPDKHLTLGELAIHAQAADAAVWKNIKPEVRNDAGI